MREGRHRYIILFLAACILLFLGASASYAMDPPHGERYSCDACHSNDILNTSGSTIDETPYNLMCSTTPGCHTTAMATHSIIETGSTARSTAWTYECRNCHNPHYQKQYWANQADYPAGAKLQKGKIVSITDNMIQVTDMGDTDPGWPADKWAGYLFQPNKEQPYLYEITGNTNNTLTTVSNVVTSYYGRILAGPGNEFGIANTSLIRDQIYAKFPVINASGGMVENTKYRPVKFLNATGSASSLGASASDYEAVCVVCHTRTKANNYGFAVHPNEHSFDRADTGLFEYAEYQGAYSHTGEYESTSQKCFDNGNSACHTGHDEGYARGGADCGSCHGGTSQMTSDTHLVTKLINASGMEETATTGGTIWAHPKHMEMGLSCDDCHDKAKGGMNPGTEDVPIGDWSIFMSFSAYDGAGSRYTGRSSGMNGFSYNGPASPTQQMTPNGGDGFMECQNLYCHSNGGNFAGAVSYPSSWPQWNSTLGSPTCSKCHGGPAADVYVSTDIHKKHVAKGTSAEASTDYGFTCNNCHSTVVNGQNAVINNSLHVNGEKNVSFSTGGTWTRDPNGTCSVYCHSDTFGGYQTANWDGTTGSLDCGGCHNKAGDASPTWSTPHTEHVNTTTYGNAARGANQITCNACHSTVTGDGSSIADYAWHVNQVANVIMNATDFGGSFNGVTCSNVKCHSTDGHSNFVPASWSGAQGCAYCHGEAKEKATMESEALLSPAHAAHLGTGAGEYGDTARIANTITCGSCHKGTTDDGTALNAGGLINHLSFSNNVVFEFSSINTTVPDTYVSPDCSNVYCHGTNMPFGSNASITNQGTGMTPDWSDTNYISGNPASDCAQCHGFPPSQYIGYEGTDSIIHDKVGKAVDNCVGCHGHLNKEAQWPTLGQWNNIALHIDGVVQYTSCTGCHGQPPLDATTIISNPEYTLMTAGAHKAHFYNGIGDQTDECDVCHLGGGAAGGHPYSYEITMGFANYVNGGATYQGISTINSVYNAGSVDANTTVLPVGSQRVCNNIYCHSDGGDVDGTYSAKQADWDGAALGCGDCHGNGAQYVITNAHPKHVAGSGTDYSFECRECHFATVDATPDIINPAIHVDFIKNVVFSAGGVTQGGSYTRPTCDSTYCHSDGMGTNVQPVWNSASTGACGTCHGVDGYSVANTPTSATHQKHLLVSEGYKFECEKCHTGVVADSTDSTDVPTIASTALHVDGFPNAVLSTGDPLVGGTATWNDSANECSNVYCHSDGHDFNGASIVYKTQAWSGSLDCSGCHDAVPATDRHTKHLSAASGYQYECFECHGATVDGANAIIGNHVNGGKDVAWGNISSGGNTYESSGTGTCANVYCHSDGVNTYGEQTADWADPNSGQCGDCHGVDATTMPASGSHVRHLELATGNNYKYECDRCHYNIVSHTADSTVVPALLDNSVHVDGAADVAMHLTDIQSGGTGTSSSWDSPTGRCSNTYCHGADVGRASFGGGADTAPTWGNTSYILGGAANAQQDCAMCHALPPNLGSHAGKGYNWNGDGSGCTGCHNHLNTTDQWGTSGQWNNLALHLNGVPDGGCEGCHGTPPRSYSTLITSPDYTARTSAGAHGRHWDYTGSFQDCYICHNGGGGNEADHPNNGTLEIHIGFTYPSVGDNPSATYTAPALSNTFTLYSAIGSTTVGTGSPWQCGSIYCHSDGGNYDQSSFVYQSPVWDATFVSSYPTTCDQCHGEGDGAGNDNYVLSTMHPKHTGTYGYACQLCHSTVVNGSMGIIDNSLHVDGSKQVALDGSDTRTSDGSWTKPSCSLYCHTRGDDNTAPFNAPLNTAQWNASLPTDCTACHGGDATVAVANRIDDSRLGAHGKHTNNSAINGKNFECAECHIATVSAGDNQQVTGIGNHVDRLVNIKFDNNGVNKDSYSPKYNTQPTTGAAGYGKTPGTALASCENVYCHSDGNPVAGSRVYNTVAWNGTFGSVCAGCHGNSASEAYPMHSNVGAGAAGSNSHYKHADSGQLAIGCNECHWQTTQDDTSIASAAVHIDGDPQNVTFRVGGPNEPGSYDTGLRQCSATYCHGSGTPLWGDTVACGDCHKANGAVAGRHDLHFEVTATNATASDWTASRDSTSSTYRYSCGVCHQESSHSNNTLYEVVLDATYAGTSTSYTAGSSQGPDPNTSYDWTNGTCATYCHSDGLSAASDTPNEAVNWNTSEGTIGCDGCHGYTAASTYVIGSSSGSARHTNHIGGTIMTANGCEYCHLDTTVDGTTIADKSMHVNVSKDVLINTTDFGSSANWNGTGCTNVYCHSDGNPAGPLYNTVAWSDTFSGSICDDCHGNGGGAGGEAYPMHSNVGAGSAGSNSHYKHADSGQLAIGCNECHWQTTQDDTSIASTALHIDGDPQNVTFRVGGPNEPGSYDTGLRQCSATYCHGSGTPLWGDTVACGDCHKANGAVAGRHDLHFEVTATNATASDWTASRDSTSSTYKYSCGVCHAESSHSNNTLYEVVLDATYAGTSTSYTAGSSQGPDPNTSYDWTNGTCATYCHSDGLSSSSNTPNEAVNWNTAELTIGCDGCHSYTAASTYVIGSDNGSTSHADHIGGTIMTANGCEYCHLDTTVDGTTIADKSMHVNVSKDVLVNTTDFGSSANWNGTGCTNVYCHSDYKNNYATPTWGTAINDCLGCHGGANASSGGAGTTLTDAHTVHTGTFSFECADCHNQVVSTGSSTIGTPANHINLSVQVNMSSGSWANPNCTGTCHGTASIDWTDTSMTTGDCAVCHGMSDTGVTGRDTNGDVSPQDLQVGAHVVHLIGANGLTGSRSISCSECHTVPYAGGGSYVENVTASGHMDGGSAEINWGTLADGTVLGGSNTSPNYSQPTCTNVYCHGATLVGARDSAPTWVNTSYLDGTGKAGGPGGDCNMCHGYPPFTAPGYDHGAGDTGCSGCHSHNGDGATHIDGELVGAGEPTELGPCVSCHDEHFKRMNDTTPGTVYKHYMNNVTQTYPIIATGKVTQDSERNCLMCHADHSLFNASLGGGQEREANLRLTIKAVPSLATVSNSGYDWSHADGGICMSCHVNEQTKAITGPHGEPNVLPIPYIDNDDPLVPGDLKAPDGSGSEQPGQDAVKIVRNSTHNYAVNMNLFTNSNKTYSAVCLKCHGDSLEKTKQRGSDLTNTLSLHQSSRDSLQAVMGSEPRGFFRGTIQSIGGALGNVVTLNETMPEDYSGFAFVLTDIKNSAGGDPTYVSNRISIDGFSAPSTVYLSSAPGTEMGADDHYEITQAATSIAEVCFNCHSHGPNDPEGYPNNGYKSADGTDFYGALDGTVDTGDVPMQQRLEKMYGLFTGYGGGIVQSSVTHSNPNDDSTWTDTGAFVDPPADGSNWVGYKVEFLTGGATGQRRNIKATDPVAKTITVEPKTSTISQNDTYKILKPAFHPLDVRGVHNTMEAFTATEGWNYGNVDDAGGTRHVGCTDCHNTHASLSNPTGEGDFLVFTANTLRDPHKTSEATEWQADRWKGYMILIEATDGTTHRRMIRYVTGSTTMPEGDANEGTTYTFATPFVDTGAIQNNNATNRYELIWHDGITGSGGKGVWGVMVNSPAFFPGGGSTAGQAPTAGDFKKKFDTSFDVDLDGSGLRGKQYMQCFRCHTYYAWGSGGQIPNTPSGHADSSVVQETDILEEFNVNNYAHHAVLGVGNNQPISPDGTGSLEDPSASPAVINPWWPLLPVTTDSSGISSGVVTLGGTDELPRNALPGWYVERSANPGEWYQIVDITDIQNFTIAETNGNPFDLNPTYPSASGTQTLNISAGLGNAFVPPFGPWSVIRCSDCHGSTLEDPVGPHASVNSWLIRDAEQSITFEWMSDNSGTVDLISYGSAAEGTQFPKAFICFNCHRADVYAFMLTGSTTHASGNNATLAELSRVTHGNAKAKDDPRGYSGIWAACGNRPGGGDAASTLWPQWCRNCHAGDKIGGIHGTWLTWRDPQNNDGTTPYAGYRFLNGSAWDGSIPPTTATQGECYTVGTSYVDTRVTSCDHHGGGGGAMGTASMAAYDY